MTWEFVKGSMGVARERESSQIPDSIHALIGAESAELPGRHIKTTEVSGQKRG